MDKLAKQQACQLFIEQEVEKGLKADPPKSPAEIGRYVATFVNKIFEVELNPETIEKRAQRVKNQLGTNVPDDTTVGNEKKNTKSKVIKPKRGGKRKGAGRPPRLRLVPDQTHFRTSFTGENESYTPVIYTDAARKVLGEIDLDPASSDFGQERIKAKKFYTEKENGLTLPWIGRIWINPPYSQPLIFQYIKKAVSEYECGNILAAIILTNNYTDTAWFHLAESVSSLVCFTKGRIKFEKKDGSAIQAMNGQAFFYWGENLSVFREIFGGFGFIR